MRHITCITLFIILLAGCSAPIVSNNRIGYIHPDFRSEDLNGSSLALLPVATNKGQEAYQQPLGNVLNTLLDSTVGQGIFVPWHESLERMEDAGLAEDYQSDASSYINTSRLDKELLVSIGRELEVKYLMFVSLEDYSGEQKVKFSLTEGSKPKWTKVNVIAEIRSAATGKKLWEGRTTAKSETEKKLQVMKGYEEHAARAARGIYQLLTEGEK